MKQVLALMDLKIRLVFANVPVCMTLLMPVGLTLIARNVIFVMCIFQQEILCILSE